MRKIIFLVLLFVAGLAWSQEISFEPYSDQYYYSYSVFSMKNGEEVLIDEKLITGGNTTIDLSEFEGKEVYVELRVLGAVEVEYGTNKLIYSNYNGSLDRQIGLDVPTVIEFLFRAEER